MGVHTCYEILCVKISRVNDFISNAGFFAVYKRIICLRLGRLNRRALCRTEGSRLNRLNCRPLCRNDGGRLGRLNRWVGCLHLLHREYIDKLCNILLNENRVLNAYIPIAVDIRRFERVACQADDRCGMLGNLHCIGRRKNTVSVYVSITKRYVLCKHADACHTQQNYRCKHPRGAFFNCFGHLFHPFISRIS